MKRLRVRLWVLLMGVLLLPPFSARAAEAPLHPLVQERLNAAGKADFFVVLKDDPAVKVLEGAKEIHEPGARRKFIIENLQQRTFRSQNDLGYWLLTQGTEYQHFWIVNQILVRNGTPVLLAQIRARKDVVRIDANPRVKLKLPPETPRQEAAPAAPVAVEWGISRIKADQVRSSYGVTGAGIVVAVQDTGVMWEHEALKNQYRGWNGATADHTYSWHDAIHTDGSSCGADAPAPCDDYGHGTHVTGTIAGYTLTNQIGVAPGAKWIACRNMNNGVGTPASYLECFQWFLAPEGDASQAPDIISNSWGCPPSEGCNPDNISTLETAVNTVTGAGILVVTSNGNYGSACATTNDPPALYRQSFSVGATDSSDNLASFSSRGPVTYKGETYIKPNISAPGVNIRSSANRRRVYHYERHLHGGAAYRRGRGSALVGYSRPERERSTGPGSSWRAPPGPEDYSNCGDPRESPTTAMAGASWTCCGPIARPGSHPAILTYYCCRIRPGAGPVDRHGASELR